MLCDHPLARFHLSLQHPMISAPANHIQFRCINSVIVSTCIRGLRFSRNERRHHRSRDTSLSLRLSTVSQTIVVFSSWSFPSSTTQIYRQWLSSFPPCFPVAPCETPALSAPRVVTSQIAQIVSDVHREPPPPRPVRSLLASSRLRCKRTSGPYFSMLLQVRILHNEVAEHYTRCRRVADGA